MRIVIDLQGAQTESRFRGIGRYSLSLAQAMARSRGNHEIWLALNARLPESIPDLRMAFTGLIPEERIRIFDVPCIDGASPWVIHAAEMVREAFLDSIQPDVVLVSSLFEWHWTNAVTSVGAIRRSRCTAVVLYDLIPLLNKKVYLPTAELQEYYYRKIDWLKNADLLLGISESSCQEALESIGVAKSAVFNISAAIGDQFRPINLTIEQARDFLARFGIDRKPILYAPGGFDPRKNFSRLIEAFGMLDKKLRSQHQLIIVSKLHPSQRMELEALARKFALTADELVLTGYIEDQDLITLYSLAELFVFPSTHEGFGLPLLEAMACGAPVIGSNCSSIPEVIGLPEALFDPLLAQSIAEKLTQVLGDAGFRERLRGHAYVQSKKFTWEESARKAFAAIESMELCGRDNAVPSADGLIAELASISEGGPSRSELIQIASSVSYNQGGGKRKQLLLDVSTIVHSDAKSGIQRVVRSLLSELLVDAPDGFVVRPIYLVGSDYRYADGLVASVSGKEAVVQDDPPADFFQGDIYLSLDLNMHLAAEMQPLHERMRLMGVKINYIVYDLLLIHRPDWWPALTGELFKGWMQRISAVANGLVCISQSVANEVSCWLRDNPPLRKDGGPRVSSFHLGADISNSIPSRGLPIDADMVLLAMSARPTFLMVSTVEPRKGHAQSLAAFELLWSQGKDVNLVIVGKQGWMVEALVEKLRNHPELGRRLFWLEGISDEYLEKVYAASTCLIAASEGEGFGLPLIEAAQHKLPIIARDIPVFREVAGEYAYYFNGLPSEGLASTVAEWLKLYRDGIHPVSDNMPWLTWKESAEQLKRALFGSQATTEA